MNITLIAIGVVILAVTAGVWALVKRIKEGARAEIAADVAEETVDILRRQDKAGNEARAEDVVERLRRGGF